MPIHNSSSSHFIQLGIKKGRNLGDIPCERGAETNRITSTTVNIPAQTRNQKLHNKSCK